MTLGGGLEWEKVWEAYGRMVDECGGGARESAIKKFAKQLEGFVIAPVDKYNQEMAIM